ncbi:MAG: type II toxin-antitoxin system HipA family toxin [Gammaproteobacteria bacterium]|nr:type II toxin-antitoxin system HipA family toxin [Gammaproteobacteria bacterium]MDE0273318.1 type II toxin-antitoxin system HipA family toxin [Gammaproteobacteria bacterium]
MTDALVNLWGRRVGAVSWDAERAVGIFEYDTAFRAAGTELSPFVMPIREAPYAFPALSGGAFNGLPGLLADALPDRFGNRLIDAWLATTGRNADTFSPVDRLCYIGSRAMGALEFEPAISTGIGRTELEVAELVDLANLVLDERAQLGGTLGGPEDQAALEDILTVGTSAGGARAKALLAWNPHTGEFRSGQVDTATGFQHWILKFDGISNNRDRELADPRGYGKIEYAYHLMARDAGIIMSECRLHHEGGRSHFMTRRFDRDDAGRKLHMQSLGALRHFDLHQAGAYAYEQAILTIRELGLGASAVEQQVRRTAFNIAARNQDDHVKNISFLMDRSGTWRLSPAYDVTYSYNPGGAWTGQHQMSVAGKRGHFERSDLLSFAESSGLKPVAARRAIEEVLGVVSNWPQYARRANVPKRDIERIGKVHRVMRLATTSR